MKQPTDFYKAAAKRASEFLLKKRKLKMKHSEALELVAAIFNQPNWQTLNAIGQNEISNDLLNESIDSISLDNDSTFLPLSKPATPWKEGSVVLVDPKGQLKPYKRSLGKTPEEIMQILNELDKLFENSELEELKLPVKSKLEDFDDHMRKEVENNPRLKQFVLNCNKIDNSTKMVELKKERDSLLKKINDYPNDQDK